MGNIFAGSEIVELGIQIEKNGRDFYNTAARQSGNVKAQGLFKFLAGEEEKHIKVFQAILEKAQAYQPQGFDSSDYYAYMNTLASEHVFTQKDKGAEIARAIKADKEVVEKAIGFEKDSVVFYEGMKKIVPDYDKKIVDDLITQEQSHLRQLTDLKKTI